MAEGDGLLNRCTALKPYRGFESLRLRFCGARREATELLGFEQGSVASRPRQLFWRSLVIDSAAAGGAILPAPYGYLISCGYGILCPL